MCFLSMEMWRVPSCWKQCACTLAALLTLSEWFETAVLMLLRKELRAGDSEE